VGSLWLLEANLLPPEEAGVAAEEKDAMSTFLICLAVYFAIPAIGIWLSGQQTTWQGWVLILLAWPIAWLFMGPEELP
jgi:hypothetical protein